MKAIVKATPSLGTVSLWWAKCTENIHWPNNLGKTQAYTEDAVGGEIAETRNAIVHNILNFEKENAHVEVTHILWIDDDVLAPPSILMKLHEHNTDVVSGVYFTKLPGVLSIPLIFPAKHDGYAVFKPDEIREAWGFAHGLSLIKLDVYKRMLKELSLSSDKYGRPQWYNVPTPEKTDIALLNITEDIWFFDNLEKLNIRPKVDCTKYAFGFHYNSALRVGYPEKQWQSHVKGEPLVWGDVTWTN